MLRAKAATGIAFAAAAVYCLPAVLFIRLIAPLLLVRFTWLPSKLIGHAVIDPEMHLCRTALYPSDQREILDLYFFESTQHSNKYWKKIVERYLPASLFFYYLHRFNALFPGWEPHYRISYAELHATADPENLLGTVDSQIRFTTKEDETGHAFLKKMGISHKDKFVCVQVRDNAHDTKLSPVGLPVSYNEFRNSEISNYVQAFEFLAEKGYWIIRMGKLTSSRLQVTNKRIIDYSNSGERTELLDLWLSFNCTFMISTGSGIDALAAIGRKPIVCVDLLAYLDTTYYFRNSLIIYKHLHEAASGRRLPLEEILSRESETYFKSSDFYWSRGLEWRRNTPEEIKSVVEEMHARLENSWYESPEDEALQSTAGAIFAATKQYQTQYKNGFVHRIGADFLRSLQASRRAN